MYFYLASKLAHNQPWLTWNSSNASSLYGILGISEFARMPWTAMITKFLVLPQNFIKLKIEASFSAVKNPLKRKNFGKIKVEDIYRNQMKR